MAADNVLIQVADAIVLELNGTPFSRPFTAVRVYRPDFVLDDLADLRVTVVPKSAGIEPATRSVDAFACAVDVAIQQRIEADDIDTLDPLVDLTQEIIDALRRTRLAALPEAQYAEIEYHPYSVEDLSEKGVFLSLITVTYRLNA